MLRNYGEAVEDLSQRANDIANYYRHYIIVPNRPEGLFGDVALEGDFFGDVSFMGDAATELRYDILANSSGNPFEGGLGRKIKKALKKGLKAVGKVASFIPGGGVLGAIGSAARAFSAGSAGGGESGAPAIADPAVQNAYYHAAANDPTLATPGADSGILPDNIDGNTVISAVVIDRATGQPAVIYPTMDGDVVCDTNCGDAASDVVRHVVTEHLDNLDPESRRRVAEAIRVAAMGGDPFEGGFFDDMLQTGQNWFKSKVAGLQQPQQPVGREQRSQPRQAAPAPQRQVRRVQQQAPRRANQPQPFPARQVQRQRPLRPVQYAEQEVYEIQPAPQRQVKPGVRTTRGVRQSDVSDMGVMQRIGYGLGQAGTAVIGGAAKLAFDVAAAPFKFVLGATKGVIDGGAALFGMLKPNLSDDDLMQPGENIRGLGMTFQAGAGQGDAILGDLGFGDVDTASGDLM